MLFYFTGTGNSLYAAKQLEQELISIPQAVRRGELTYRSEVIGIVCPVYGHEMPALVKEFLHRTRFETEYLYLVLTYGNMHGGAAELAQKELLTSGKKADYINVLKMVDNFLPGFDMEEQMALEPEKMIEEHIRAIRIDIEAHRRWISPVTEADRRRHRAFLAKKASVPADLWQHIYQVTKDCIGCGICARVCPVGCIRMKEQRAVHILGNCQMCMACIHHCPQNAIRLAVPEKNPKARYHNEHIRLMEIVNANDQRINE